jgi:CRISPR-associated RAMP protein (TIGR02581 family)
MSPSPDLSTFTSRLQLDGHLTFDSALRIGASRSLAVDEPDLPVLRTADRRPYIPGSSFKGALRSYTEAVLRTLQAQPDLSDRNLACLSVGKPPSRPAQDRSGLCLTQDEVSALKNASPNDWYRELSDGLKARLPNAAQIDREVREAGEQAVLDRVLRDLSCWTCRVFGSSWLASKVLIKDLMVIEESFYRTEIRDGVGIDRDSGRAADGFKYQFEVIPVGAAFRFDLLAENASGAELGLLWLGLNAFQGGQVLMGGAKSRGLGWCRLEIDWDACRYVTPDTLLDALLPPVEGEVAARLTVSATQAWQWVEAFFRAIGRSFDEAHDEPFDRAHGEPVTEGGDDA